MGKELILSLEVVCSVLSPKDKERQLSQTHTAHRSLASRLQRMEADQVQSSMCSVCDQDQGPVCEHGQSSVCDQGHTHSVNRVEAQDKDQGSVWSRIKGLCMTRIRAQLINLWSSIPYTCLFVLLRHLRDKG